MSSEEHYSDEELAPENKKQMGEQIGNKQYFQSPELEPLARKVIEEKGLDLGPAEIAYMLVYPNISKQVVGRAKKAQKELKFFSGYDYMIQFSGEVWDMLDDETRYILMYHELLHLDPVFRSRKQTWDFKLKKHDFNDFYAIQEEYGLNWFQIVQGTTSSLYDLDPKQENKVSV